MEIELLHDGPVVSVAAAGPLLIQLFHAKPVLEALARVDEAEALVAARHERLSTLTLLTHGSLERPDDEVRARSVELAGKYGRQIIGAAIVVDARGLVAMMARTFLSTFFLFSPAASTNRVFSSLDAALDWLRTIDPALATLTVDDVQRFVAAHGA